MTASLMTEEDKKHIASVSNIFFSCHITEPAIYEWIKNLET